MKTSHIIIALSFTLVAGCKPKYQELTNGIHNEAPLVQIEQVKVSNTPIPIEVSGVLAAKAETNLSFKIGGIIQRLFVDEGEKVQQGQVLARLELTEINAQVDQAQQAANKATRDFERIQNLYNDSVATLEQLQNLQTAQEVAQADLRIASFNRRYAEIRAPFEGRVQRRHVEAGELVNPGSPIVQVGNSDATSAVMRISVSDRDIVRLSLGDSAHIHFDAYERRAFKARVTELAQAANPGTGTFEVELTVEAAPGVLRSGFVGKASIFPSKQDPYYQISMNALVEGDEFSATIFAYDPENKQALRLQLDPEYITDQFFTVSAQQQELKQIITAGGHYLQHGQNVRINAKPQ